MTNGFKVITHLEYRRIRQLISMRVEFSRTFLKYKIKLKYNSEMVAISGNRQIDVIITEPNIANDEDLSLREIIRDLSGAIRFSSLSSRIAPFTICEMKAVLAVTAGVSWNFLRWTIIAS